VSAASRGGLWISRERRLAVLVASGAGGVGRSSVSALLAAALHTHTVGVPGDARHTAVLDCAPRGQSPWPEWVSGAAQIGTAALAAYRGTSAAAAADLGLLVETGASTLRLPDAEDDTPALRVIADTGSAAPGYLGADPGPRWWLPVLPSLRTAVIDGDALEGARIAAQADGGAASSAEAWLKAPFVNSAVVWVTDNAEQSLRRTVQAQENMARARIPVERVVVAVTDRQGTRRHGPGGLAAGWRELLAGRAAAVVELGYDRAVADRATPRLDAAALSRPPIAALAVAVAEAARIPWLDEGEEPPAAGQIAPSASALMSESVLRYAAQASLGSDRAY
jgi:hypothetical protein